MNQNKTIWDKMFWVLKKFKNLIQLVKTSEQRQLLILPDAKHRKEILCNNNDKQKNKNSGTVYALHIGRERKGSCQSSDVKTNILPVKTWLKHLEVR